MLGRTISHYRIDQPLGAGGMGTVYLAHDLALERPTALKIVSGADADFRHRLVREAAVSARLQHPAIATFYESDAVDAIAFIAMEFIRGDTLREVIRRGPLTIDQALELAVPLLEALHHAHAAGILHRDLKPENIMRPVAGGVKLLDFGIAQVLGQRGLDPTITTALSRSIAGTPGYMAPEQMNGAAVDERTDVFGFGAVLYEMIAGRSAFPGAFPGERIIATLTRDPAPLEGSGRHAMLDAICRRAMAREPSARFASVKAMLAELRALDAGEAPSLLPETLAILDLRNLAGRSEDDWIGSGVAESLAADLTRQPGLTVLPRARVLRAMRDAAGHAQAGEPPDPLEVAARLGSRWVLHGSFQRLGAAVRITTSLAEVATGRTAAAEKLDGSIDGIFDLQDRLSRAIAASLNLRTAAPTPPPRNVDAFECYARGRRLWVRLEKGTFEQAGDLYRQAIEIQPHHALALSGLAALHAMRFTFTTDPGELETAAGFAERAIAADPRLGEPHIWLGYAHWRLGREADALREEQEAARLDPQNPYAPYFEGCVHVFAGRPAQSIPLFQRTLAIDATHGFAWMILAGAHAMEERFAEAEWCLARALELEAAGAGSASVGSAAYLGECFRLTGRLADGRAACLRALDAIERSDHMYRDSFRGIALCVLGRIALDAGDAAAAEAAFRQAIAHVSGRDRTLGGGYLMVQALAGLARAGSARSPLDEARQLFERRDRFDFSRLWTCTDDSALLELGRAALHAGDGDAIDLLERASAAGSREARRLLDGHASGRT